MPPPARRLPFVLLAPSLIAAAPAAQSTAPAEPPRGVLDLGETLVTASRRQEQAFEAPAATEVVDERSIRERAYRTTPQALRDLPGIMVQETSHGQGSPYIRGFTGFRNLFLVDGIRLNNSVLRDGPNQYWNTVDPFSVERIEVVKGPSSVLYGSDAVGGTVQAITKDPYAYGRVLPWAGFLHYRVATAEESHVVRGEASLAQGEELGVLVGVTGKTFGDVQGGEDIGRQPNTGYDEWDADVKVERFLDPNTRLVVAYQHVRQNDVPRTHSTAAAVPFEGTTPGSDLRRDLDQERQLAYVQLHGEAVGGLFDDYMVSLSWHDQREFRDRIRGNGNQEFQGFDVDTLGFGLQLGSHSSIGRLTYGLDAYHDDVSSFSSRNPIQGPVADDATYDLVGVYLQDELQVNEDLSVTLGARFNHAAADADSVLDPVTSTRTSIDDDWSAVVGSARFSYAVDRDETRLFGGVSQGFRAPNLSDLTRFDTARTNEFEIPSPGLEPERFLTYELGVKRETESHSSQVAVFYTDVEDAIVRFPTGATNGAGEFEITKDNVGDGHVYGIEVGGAWRFRPAWTVFGASTYMEGEVDTFPTSAPVIRRETIDRQMPWTTQLGLRWDEPGGASWAELVATHADDADELSTRDAGDTGRIPPGGTPDYLVLHLRAGGRIDADTSWFVALENLTDEDYRVHGSGQNMAGMNLVLGVSLSL